MSYMVNEIFYSLQGEGLRAGSPAVFLRFSGCNLWSGREEDRSDADCPWCDTDFRGTEGEGGGRYADAAVLADVVAALWPKDVSGRPLVVVTGGEPGLQLDDALVAALHGHGFAVAVETNGTQPLPDDLDWITVSPKAGVPLHISVGDELKLVYPQDGAAPADYEGLVFSHFLLQPLDGPQQAANQDKAVAYCKAHPRWRLSLQLHKVLGIK